MAREGAYSKAVAALTSEVAEFPAPQQVQWATELLPGAEREEGTEVTSGGPHAAAAVADAAGCSDRGPPLRGVRFPAMSAPGPSGTRPEHLREALSVRSRPVANRLLSALGQFIDAASSGSLPEGLRWITRSRLVFLRKKSGPKPRPIRVGEVLRRIVAKRLVHDHRSSLCRFFLGRRQFGVAVPGGADALIQFRMDMEAHFRNRPEKPLVAVDVDLVNAFPRFNWSAIRSSVARHQPHLSPWTSWCHREAAVVVLPCGAEVCVDRGAEQGDPLGPAYCGYVIADAVEAALASLADGRQDIFDVWFMDDGQVFLPPELVDPFLRALDQEFEKVGATRGRGPTVKSTARLLSVAVSPPGSADWATDYVRASCKVLDPADPIEILGVRLGAPAEEQVQEAISKMAEVHEALGLVADSGVELTLARHCADACRLMHQLRARGPEISSGVLQTADQTICDMLHRIVGGPVPVHCSLQASLAVRGGGLGLRKAAALAAPAYVAARVDARPLVVELLAQLPSTWGQALVSPGPSGADSRSRSTLSEAFDARTAAAVEALRGAMAPPAAGCLDQVLMEGSHLAAERCSALIRPRDTSPEALAAAAAHPLVDVAPGTGVASDARSEGLQTRLSELADGIHLDQLLRHFADTEDWEGLRRVEDLRHSDCDHDWLLAINPAFGAYVPPDEYADGIRIRLGLDFTAEPVPCAACEDGMLEPTCAHALRCAPGACTRGHNDVRSALMSLASLADPAALLEPLGVIPSAPNVRPADVLSTAALPGCTAALDVGVMSPSSIGAGADCCEAMVRRKLGTYAAHWAELTRRGVRYIPFALSCFGRLHPEASVTIRRLAAAAARRQGAVSAQVLDRRARCWISVAIVRRAVAMVRACLPPLPAEQAAVLLGADPAGGFAEGSAGDAASAVVRRGAAAALLAA